MTDRTFQVALIGAGYVARFHAEALKKIPGVRLAAVCDPDRARAERLAAASGARTCGSLDEVRDLRIDAAHVLTPPAHHVSVARRLLADGTAVLVEKPMALSVEDAALLQADAARAGLTLAVNHNNVFHPAFERLASAIRAGVIGRLEHVRGFFHVPIEQLKTGQLSHWMFQAPANIIFESAVHPFSQMVLLAGALRSMNATVLSTVRLSNGVDFHDRWAISAIAERASAELHLSFGGTFARNTLEVIGSDGSLEADLLHNVVCGEQKTYWLDFWNSYLASARRARAYRRDAVRGALNYLSYTSGLGPRRDPYYVGMQQCITEFYNALREGRQPLTGAASGVETIRWCDAAAAVAAAPPARRTRAAAGPARPGETVVLGGTGLIGRRVGSALAARRIPTTLVVRRPDTIDPDEFTGDHPVRIVRGALENPSGLADALRGARTVIHLATGNGETWQEVHDTMVEGTVALATEALAAGVQRFIYVSSIAALYLGEPGATIQDSREVDPQAHRRDVYSRGKAETERRLYEMFEQSGLPLVVVRPGVVLGPESPIQHSGLGWWPRDNHCLGWGAGTNALPLVTADDVADGIVRAACADGESLHGRALNLCARPPISARELVEAYAEASGRPIRFHRQPLWYTFGSDVFKWGVKSAAARMLLPFPSYRDLKSRALRVSFACGIARDELGWRPIDDREAFLAYLRDASVRQPTLAL
jgi:predicted dehydrogenase/nucleoside-diphosphate-sugar epimerase